LTKEKSGFMVIGMGNETLIKAGKAKNDEFYTQLLDIEK
jgi:hypothetical protein